ncbi:SRPBCC family protein [Sphingobium sp. LMA1-1-1.1]|uniref:SRPBCC family protein n=1 Tax=Sphingobium sp. LMA1-1-1.1 TaxID=3135238 RepID=UPI003427BB96
MRILETEITIDASPHAVWSVLDDLDSYPEWNKLVPDLTGRTTVGQTVRGTLVQANLPDVALQPELTRIVGARELRWLTDVPGEQGFTAEHCFILEPLQDGTTRVRHFENFDGPFSEIMWPGIDIHSRVAYNQMNVDLKARVEALASANIAIHPCVDAGQRPQSEEPVEHLTCKCTSDPVEASVVGPVYHSHLCGCSKCWKPEGALFALTAVAPSSSIQIRSNAAKLAIVDENQSIQRHACTSCGAHMVGKVPNPDHHFYGLDFLHPELGNVPPRAPEFAGFVSSIVETGTPASKMSGIRRQLADNNIAAYDAFSPELMDLIAWHKVKISRAASLSSKSPIHNHST